MDIRGHGRGITPDRAFRLSDCADDVAGLAHELAIDRFVAVGYSMGGAVAQLLWRDHRHLVAGLVLCATSRDFRSDLRCRTLLTLYPAASLFVRIAAPELGRAAGKLVGAPGSRTEWREWIRSEIARTSPRAVLQAAAELKRFSSNAWAPQIDVPTAVVVTNRDGLVPTRRQCRLADAIPGATVFEVNGDHFVCSEHPEAFLGPLDAACRSVAGRITPVRTAA
jgi:pimeloyl-ACP methyl ester carboxylesterase